MLKLVKVNKLFKDILNVYIEVNSQSLVEYYSELLLIQSTFHEMYTTMFTHTNT